MVLVFNVFGLGVDSRSGVPREDNSRLELLFDMVATGCRGTEPEGVRDIVRDGVRETTA